MTRWAPVAVIYLTCIPGVCCGSTPAWNAIAGMEGNPHLSEEVIPAPILLHGFEGTPGPDYNRDAYEADLDDARPWFQDQALDRPTLDYCDCLPLPGNT